MHSTNQFTEFNYYLFISIFLLGYLRLQVKVNPVEISVIVSKNDLKEHLA